MKFNQSEAEYAVKFIQLLKLTDDFHGEPFLLMDWQKQILETVYGSMNQRGARHYRQIYIETPKKNAKSQLLGGIACLHLFKTNEPNSHIYGCAGTRDQAGIIFDATVEMILQNPTLEKLVRIQAANKRITNKQTGSTYRVLSSEAFSAHGYKTSVVLFDELHVQPNRNMWDVMTKGTGLARKQPMWWVITTAGMDPDRVTIGWEVHEKAEAILKARAAKDKSKDIPTWYPVIYNYTGEDIWNEKNWRKANPSLGTTFQIEDLREIATEAKLSPADELLFRWLHLNQWPTNKLTSWLPLDLFDQTALAPDWTRGLLLGKDCYPGLDLSSTIDLSSLCLIFPKQEGLEKETVIWDFWIPEDTMTQRIREDRVPYDLWAAGGWIHPTPGNSIDYTKIENRIVDYSQMYNIVQGGADMKFAAMLLQRLNENHGIEFVDVPQQYGHLTDPMQSIEVDLRKGDVQHEANPVARWCFGNTSIASNGSGLIKYVKERRGRGLVRTKRIDGTAAWVIAKARAKFYEQRVDLSAILDDDWGM